MGVTQINLGDSTERKCTKYGLAHQIPPDLSVRHILSTHCAAGERPPLRKFHAIMAG